MTTKDDDPANDDHERRGLSWPAMLGIVALAILVAAACAYLLVNPFFHQSAPQR